LKKATGVTFEVEIDWLVWVDAVEAKGYKDRAGEIFYDWYARPLPFFPCLPYLISVLSLFVLSFVL